MDMRKLTAADDLDDLIRDSLVVEARRSSADSAHRKTLMQMMQRAQTEVCQLPAVPAEVTVNVLTEVTADYPLPMPRAYHEPLSSIPRTSFYERITEYRELMNMKMWRTCGPLSFSRTA